MVHGSRDDYDAKLKSRFLLPIPSRQIIDESISITDFFPPFRTILPTPNEPHWQQSLTVRESTSYVKDSGCRGGAAQIQIRNLKSPSAVRTSFISMHGDDDDGRGSITLSFTIRVHP